MNFSPRSIRSCIANAKHTVVKPGDKIAIPGLDGAGGDLRG